MKFELSHDILAKKVYEKSSSEDKMLRKVEGFIKERHEYFLAQGVMLGKKDLEYIGRYLDDVDTTEEQDKFIAKSRKRVKKSEGRKVINSLLLFVLPILIGLLCWALYQTYEANQAVYRAKKAVVEVKKEKDRADKNALNAENALATVKVEKAKADEARDVAEKQTVIANNAKANAVRQAEKARVQAKIAKSAQADAEKQRKLAVASAEEARKAEKRAKDAALEAKENEKDAIAAKKRADDLAAEAIRLKKQAEEEADKALAAEAIAKREKERAEQAEKEARALYLASLADNALRLDKGIIAYNLAKTSWQLNKNLVAQKVLFDCQNVYVSNQKIFEEYKQTGFKSYVEQSSSEFNMKSVKRNLDAWGTKFLNRIDFGNAFDIAKFSPNRKMIATILFKKNRTKIRSTSDGSVISDIKTKARISDVQFSEDNKYVLLLLADNSAELHKITASGTLLGKFQHEAKLNSAEFSPKGGKVYIATVSSDKVGKLWNSKGDLIKSFDVYDASFPVLPYYDGKQVLMLGKDGTPQLLNVVDNQATQMKVQKRSRDDNSVKAIFSPNGKHVLTQTQEGAVELWNINGVRQAYINHKGSLDVAKFSPDGDEILTSSNKDNFAELWNLKGQPLGKFYFSGLDPINSVEFSKDGFRVLIGRSAIANLWGSKGRLLYSFDPDKPIASASFSSDYKSVMVATRDGSLDIWNIVRPEEIIEYYDDVVKIRPLNSDEQIEYGLKSTDF